MFYTRHVLCYLFIVLCIACSMDGDKRKYSFLGKKKYRPSSPYVVRRSGLSSNKFKYIFGTTAALGAIYVASRMRPHVHLRSYNDLYSHTICEGERSEFDDILGSKRIYRYFLCPDNPDQPFERYCCQNEVSSYCCSQDEKVRYYYSSRWGLIGGSVAALAILGLLGAIMYCLCCRTRHRQPTPPPMPQPAMVTIGGQSAFEPSKPGYPTRPPPACPYPSQSANGIYPAPPVPPPNPIQPGSGWTAPPANQPGSGWAEIPPPPYSACVQAAPSAPPPT